MDTIWLKRQLKSMGASVKIQTLSRVPQRFERRRIIDRLNVKAGPRGEVFTYACRAVLKDQVATQLADACPDERRLVLIITLSVSERAD